jgi:hypothetical protein
LASLAQGCVAGEVVEMVALTIEEDHDTTDARAERHMQPHEMG